MQTNCWIGLYAGNMAGNLGGSALMDAFGVPKNVIFYLSAACKGLMLAVALAVVDPPVRYERVCATAAERAAVLTGELAASMRRKRVWMPALFIWIWNLHPAVADSWDAFLLQTPNATPPNANGPQPLGFSPTEYSIQGTVGTIGAPGRNSSAAGLRPLYYYGRRRHCTLLSARILPRQHRVRRPRSLQGRSSCAR